MEAPHPLPHQSIEEILKATDAGPHWKKIGIRPRHGMVVPLFSLKSEQSCGIGELTDLPLLIDLCIKCKMNIIQLLPINDTGVDASPYAALSAFALNPVYIGLDALPYFDKEDQKDPAYRELKDLNGAIRIPYTLVRNEKIRFLRAYYQRHKEKILKEPGYQEYVKKSSWLPDYALFTTLHSRHLYKGWETWPAAHKDPSEEALKKLFSECKEEIAFHQVLQYLADRQMRAAKAHADEQDFLLMGDVPILVGRDSCDVWRNRKYFNLDFAAGAPPDFYAANGQNWGLPCYHWDVLEKEDFSWWEGRLSVVSRHFHLYRIDHVIGFFRIWAIPPKCPAKEGQYVPDTFPEWFDQGVKLMRMLLKKSTMLPLGEDLGVIPPAVRRVLQVLGISGTRVTRWEEKKGGSYVPKEAYSPASLTTVSIHDADNMRLYWQRYPDKAKELATFLGFKWKKALSEEDLEEILRWSHGTASLFHINPIQEYLALEKDLASRSLENERINLPGTLSVCNWSYRLSMPLEALIKHKTFSKRVASLLP